MSRKEFAIHVIAGLVGIAFMCLGIAELARRPLPSACPVEEDDAPRSETP